jgi:hypothetical protein
MLFSMLVLQLEIMAAANVLEGYPLSFVLYLTTNVHTKTMTKNPSKFGLSCISVPTVACSRYSDVIFSEDTVALSA